VSLTVPFTFSSGNKAKSSEVNANFAAVAAKFSTGAGGINDSDISSSCDFDANKLSVTPGKRIIANKFETGAVDSTALKKDPNAGSPNAAVNDPTHVKDGILGKAKLSTVVGQKVTVAQLDLLVEDVPFSVNVGSVGVLTGIDVQRQVSGLNYVIGIRYQTNTGGGGSLATLSPTTPIPTATRHLLAAFPVGVTWAGNIISGSVCVVSIAKT